MIQGRFFDGQSAIEHVAQVRFEPDGLALETHAGTRRWPRKGLDAVRFGADLRLTSRADPDARLIVPATAEAEAALKALGVHAGAKARRALWLGGSLIAAGVALTALIFFGAPLAAEPLARATPRDVEAQLGENLTRQVFVVMRPCENAEAAEAAIAPLVSRIAALSDAGFEVKLAFVRARAPNAFALPGGRIFVTSGLLEALEHPDELAAVLAHEIGHVHARDSMIALYRNVGLGIFLEAVTGGTGIAQQIILLSGQLAELRYSRGQETRADAHAIATVREAGLDPEALARAFERIMGKVEGRSTNRLAAPEWLLSHPDVEARIANARAAATPATAQALSPEDWALVRAACAHSDAED